MDIEKLEKKWNDYEYEFDNSEDMDIEKHIYMASNVGSLISEIKRLTEIIELNKLPLHPCNVCGKEERNPGLNVCGDCYHKQIWGND